MTNKSKEERRESKRQQEIARLERLKNRPGRKGYFWYLMLILCVVYITDEITTAINGQFQNVLAQSIFAPIFGADVAVARMSAFGMVIFASTALAYLYKPLSDRFGRKIFLVINTVGMGVGLFFIALATNIPVYLLGCIVTSFFTPHDMQMVYISETAEPKHRAKTYSIMKALSTIGIMLIPALRSIFMAYDTEGWRIIYFIFSAMAVVVAILAAFLVRESDVFVEERLRYLKMTAEEREKLKQDKAKKASTAQGGILAGLKYTFKNRQVLWLFVAGGFLMFGMLYSSYYETIMTRGYAAAYVTDTVPIQQAILLPQVQAKITQALYLFTVGSALAQLVPGFIADKLGRKASTLVMSVLSTLAFVAFISGARYMWSPYVVGLLCGIAVGSYWGAGDMSVILVTESVPTNLRASVSTVQPVISGWIYSFAMMGIMAALNILGDAYAGVLSLMIAVPGMALGIFLLIFKVKEKRNVDLRDLDREIYEK